MLGFARFEAIAATAAFALATVSGCASVKVTDQQAYTGEQLPRPGRIIVHDFAASESELPAWSDAAENYAEPLEPRSEHELETGRQLGAHVAEMLVEDIRAMDLPAVRAEASAPPQLGDIVIIGYFSSIEAGSAVERVAIGFGAGAAELTTSVEAYRMEEGGLRKLGSGTTTSHEGKGPGVAVPLAVTIATANPIGLIVGGAVKAEGEMSGRSTIEGVAKRTADTIAERLQTAFEKQGWI
ncbi:MAG TPA: DUF4410 domain-containing protein [Myxococcota bacterium]|nr:DUF4410 domain-containing protein [Myxococcota bacterium]